MVRRSWSCRSLARYNFRHSISNFVVSTKLARSRKLPFPITVSSSVIMMGKVFGLVISLVGGMG